MTKLKKTYDFMAKFELEEHFSKGCDQAAKVRSIRNKTSLRAFISEISELHFAQ